MTPRFATRAAPAAAGAATITGELGDSNRRSVGRLALVLALAALLCHLWLLGRSTVDSDEAIVGLMARAILHGHFSAFYWGQPYGGSEAYVTAALFGLLGASAFTLKCTAALLSAVAALLTWRLGRRLAGESAGRLAGALCFAFPEADLYASVKEYGFRWVALCAGLVALLASARLLQGARGRAEWSALGLALGIGWWSTPEIAYAAVPVAVALLLGLARRRLHVDWGRAALALGTLLLGALPWLWANVRDDYASLRPEKHQHYAAHLATFATRSLPMALGLRLRTSGRWLLPLPLSLVAYGLFVALLLFGAARLATRPGGELVVLSLVSFPLLYAALPVNFWIDGRFTLALGPVVAIALAAAVLEGAASLAGARRRPTGSFALAACGALVALCVALSGDALASVEPGAGAPEPLVARGALSWHADPNNLVDAAIVLLHRHAVTDVFAGYWLAYPVTELSGATIAATDVPLPVRDAPLYDEVVRSAHPAWLFVTSRAFSAVADELRQQVLNPGCTKSNARCLDAGQFEGELTAAHVAYSAWDSGAFTVVEPRRPVAVAWVLRRP